MTAVGILSPFYPPHLGGMERALERIAAGLARAGVDVTVHTSMHGSSPRHPGLVRHGNLKVLRDGHDLRRWGAAAREWAARAEVDAVLVTSFGPDTRSNTIAALKELKRRGIRTVWRSPTADHARRNLFDAANALEAVDIVVANSRASADRTTEVIGRQVEVIRNLVLNDELLSARGDAELEPESDIAWVGRVTRRKRPEDLLAVLASLATAGRSVHIQATPGYGEERLFRSFLDQVPLEITLHAPEPVQPRAIRLARMFVHLSDVEGSPNSVLEAALRGSLPATSDIPECRELLTGTSGALLPPDVHEATAVVNDLLARCTRSMRVPQHFELAERHAEGVVIPQWVNVLSR